MDVICAYDLSLDKLPKHFCETYASFLYKRRNKVRMQSRLKHNRWLSHLFKATVNLAYASRYGGTKNCCSNISTFMLRMLNKAFVKYSFTFLTIPLNLSEQTCS